MCRRLQVCVLQKKATVPPKTTHNLRHNVISSRFTSGLAKFYRYSGDLLD